MISWELGIMLKKLEDEYRQLNRELLSIGGGNLNYHIKSGNYYFREYNNYSQKGITKNKKRVYQLARKEYLKNRIREIKLEISALKKAKTTVDSICDSADIFFDKYKMLDRDKLMYTPKQQAWLSNRNSENPFKREHLRYVTGSGIMVRSKSERFIGDFLDEKGLIYKYESEIIINGRPIYPDFMVLREDGRTVIWEHFGLTDNTDYFNNMMIRLNEYRQLGYVQHYNLICTYEENLRSKETLEEIVRRFLLI